MIRKLGTIVILCMAALGVAACGKDDKVVTNVDVTTKAIEETKDVDKETKDVKETTKEIETKGITEITGTLDISGTSVADSTEVTSNAKVGNTAGNLINTGIVCESSDKIYYYNRVEDKKLYVMNKDGSDKKSVFDIVGATELNVNGEYLYYLSNGMYRVNIKSGENQRLVSENCRNLVVCDDVIYYIKVEGDNNRIYSCSLDGSNDVKLSDNMASSLNVSGGYIYYINGSDANRVYKMALDGSNDEEVSNMKNVQELLIGNGYIYMVSSSKDGNKLYRMARTMHEGDCIISDTVSNINMYNGGLFYYNASKDALCFSAANGSDEKELCSGKFNAVNVIANWVYFFDTEDKNFYRIGKDGNNYEKVE